MRIEHIAMYVKDLENAKTVSFMDIFILHFQLAAKKKWMS